MTSSVIKGDWELPARTPRLTGILSVTAWHDQIGDENLHGVTVLVQRRGPHLDQPLAWA